MTRGYTLSFTGSLTSINVAGGEHNPVAVDNGQWTVSPPWRIGS
ncbi:hypothetical protein [Spirosoma sp. KCTC 42546]|nr:hypothetical protein [Spirosoma sp. KCTC 42546]